MSIDDLRREAEELRASRARVLAAADAQRRAVERALHDGTMQHLTALSAHLQLARRLCETDPPAAGTLLDEMVEHVHEALAEAREIAWRVYPSLLPGSGLADALRTSASLLGMVARVETSAASRLSPELEMPVYFACVELLQHAAAGGHGATVRIGGEQDDVLFSVAVEGDDIERWRAIDLHPVEDRLAALGLRLVLDAIPRGVRAQALVAERCSSAR